MQQIETFIFLFAIIIAVAQLFNKIALPVSLFLVIVGIILSLIPNFPIIQLSPEVVLNIFLPILVYQIASFSSWIDIRKNLRQVALLSVGHVLFITILVALVIHYFIPQLGWPLAFVLGAVLSPPDDVAIVTIAEKIRLPRRVTAILIGEGLLNDATALTIFRIALAAVITNQFIISTAITQFLMIIILETVYGVVVGYLLGEVRRRLTNTTLHMMASLLTPFLAYIPAVALGGSGIIATAVAGFLIGHRYAVKFTPEFRLVSRALWPTMTFIIDCILFLWVGLEAKSIYDGISAISITSLIFYASLVVLTLIIGRFIWVFVFVLILPRLLFPSIKKKDPYPPWQFPFIVSWAGMRGSISLAAALAVPFLPNSVEGANPRYFLIYLVFSAIVSTFLLQGLTLPWVMKKIGIRKYSDAEHYNEHLAEIHAKEQITDAIVRWLKRYQREIKNNPKLLTRVKVYIQQYEMQKSELKETISQHEDGSKTHDESIEERDESFLQLQIAEIERIILIDLWRQGKISFDARNRLLDKLDHRSKH